MSSVLVIKERQSGKSSWLTSHYSNNDIVLCMNHGICRDFQRKLNSRIQTATPHNFDISMRGMHSDAKIIVDEYFLLPEQTKIELNRFANMGYTIIAASTSNKLYDEKLVKMISKCNSTPYAYYDGIIPILKAAYSNEDINELMYSLLCNPKVLVTDSFEEANNHLGLQNITHYSDERYKIEYKGEWLK